MQSQSTSRQLKRADPSTIQNKFLVGYQGWFTCPGDGPPLDKNHHGWLHWFNKPLPQGGRPNTDLWPDLSEYSASELYPAPGLTYENGDQAYLFSSRNPQTVRRHFHWMALHGVDGALLQRFSGQTDIERGNGAIRQQRDDVGESVQAAAEQEGRVYAIMYDVSGVKPDRIEKVIKDDWLHLINDKKILDSRSYLRENGRPVLVLWGLGFHNRGFKPQTTREIVRFIRQVTPGGAYIMAGAPTHWQTLTGDADRDPEYLNVWYNEFDAISPWTVGRYANEEEADRFAVQKVRKDIEALKQHSNGRKVDYIPVVLPGGSGSNLSEGKWPFNAIRRNGGKFLWRQISNVRKEGVNIIYGAMWDEYDEGTAYMPVVSSKNQLPRPGQFLSLDADGYDLPSDWYMRICGLAAEILRGERNFSEEFPLEDLQNYWSTHPRYEDDSNISFAGNALEDLSAEEPPPPYTLEADVPPVPPKSTRPVALSSNSRPLNNPPSVNVSTRPHQATGSANAHSRSPPIHVANKPRVTEISSVATLEDQFSRHTISDHGGTSIVAMPMPSPTPEVSGPSHGQWSNSQWPPAEWQSSSSVSATFPVPETSGHPQTTANYPVYSHSHQTHHHHHSNSHPHTPTSQGSEVVIPQFPIPQTSPPPQPFPHSPSPAHSPYQPQPAQYPYPSAPQQYHLSQPSTSNFSPSPLPPPPPPPNPYSNQTRPGSSRLTNDVLNYTLNTVDRLAGSDARRHMEKGVESISKTGSKLFNKFTK